MAAAPATGTRRSGEGHLSAVEPRRAPPHDVGLEEAVVGVALLDPGAAEAIQAELVAEALYVPTHAHVFAAIVAVAGRGELADVHNVSAELRRAGLLGQLRSGEAEGAAVLTELLAKAGLRSQAVTHARTLARYARAREVIGRAELLAEAGYAADLEQAATVAAETTDALGAREVGASTWQLVDVAALLRDGLSPLQPTMLARTDGAALLYPGRTHAVAGEPESGKSFVALWACAERMALGEPVLYLDFEADGSSVLERLLALGLGTEALSDRFHYVRPDEPFGSLARAQLLGTVRAHRPTLAVIDGVAEAMASNNWNENINAEVAAFFGALPRLLEREECAVLLVDHLTKDRENQGRYARGAGHKLAGLSGAGYKLEVIRPFGRGVSGSAKLIVTKDRSGWVRRVAVGAKAAEVYFDARGDGTVSVRLEAPAEGASERFRPTVLMEHVSRVLEVAQEPLSVNQVLESTRGNRDARITALRVLVEEGYVERVTGARGAHLHRSVTPFRHGAAGPEAPPEEEF